MQEEPVLSDIRDDDKTPLFELINNPEILVYNSQFAHIDWEAYCTWFDAIGLNSSKRLFAITDPPSKKFVGSLCIDNIHPIQRSAEISTIVTDSEANQDITIMALSEAVGICWHQLDLNRIYTHALSSREREKQAYLANGFKIEGILRAHACFDGQYQDLEIMGLLRPSEI